MRQPPTPRLALAIALPSLLAASFGCGAAPTPDGPAAPDPLEALAGDSARILEELRHLSSDAFEGRGTGTEGLARARSWLARKMADAGIRPLGGELAEPFRWRRGAEEEVEGVNLVGFVPGGERPGRYLVLSAHLDHLGIRNGEIYNGADDDASGAVALVALARALRGHPLRHALLVAAFDAEEVGLRGARAFVTDPPVPLDSIELDLNLDMVARTGGVLWAAGAHSTPALRPLLEGVAAQAPLELRLGHDGPDAPGGEDWTQSSDHAPFHEAGIPFVYLGVDDHPDYHRPTDDFENIDPGEYMDALRTALLTLLALDRAPALPVRGAPARDGGGEGTP